MSNGNLVVISISLTKEEARKFKELYESGHRGASDQFKLMLTLYLENREYLENKGKVK